ncbi:WD40-repeat-containing domain protein [Pseudomassariella vexata]|uniref:WD40-repeat-containing domain protein n=1 Tax=Pseudomassariella vexata TaxID=1141098 RepID=A0A1Y2DVJ6_9PEZI|nr:WD40-repeat-containing domain protein [Pseudomassariella vexata]ORY63277.1 WD40-repeat-containing domain protein [Pseudomassariella vexata]
MTPRNEEGNLSAHSLGVALEDNLADSHTAGTPKPLTATSLPLLPTLAASDGPGNSQTPSSIPGKKSPIKFPRKETPAKDGASNDPPATAIDPLSHHIFVRTNTEKTLSHRLLGTGRPDSPANEGPGLPRPSADLSAKPSTPQGDQGKDKKKGGSFLSRLGMIGNKKKGDVNDDDSEISELRTEGANAVAFSSTVGAAGYIPHHKEPPRYIRVRANNKKVKEFNRMFLAQELVGTRLPSDHHSSKNRAIDAAPVKPVHGFGRKDVHTGGPIWAAEFSRDGKYLATAGRDRVVRVWGVLATAEDRNAHQDAEKDACDGAHLSAPVFHSKPVREFTGHEGEILDLSWSKNNFLLSSSMDKTVRLWHMSRNECLCSFKHKDFVTSIAFHPRDDRFFLAGSLDSALRLWSIPDKAVAYSSQLADLITAVAFSPDGKTAIAGCLNGICNFYETEGLKFQTQIHVRSSRGKNAKGSKITGIQCTDVLSPGISVGGDVLSQGTNGAISHNSDGGEVEGAGEGEVKVLVSSNDSRIRIYNLRGKELETKFKGHTNNCNQIRASFSDDGQYVVCGSEDRRAFIWSTESSLAENKDKQDKRPCEYFEAHSDVVTQAVFAPTGSRQLLQTSDDPIFTLCNPPPVTLISKDEATVSQTTWPNLDKAEAVPKINKPEETPAFIARSKHQDGHILVTTDYAGIIKVFRQDCAFAKRKHETWETGSSFSKRLARDNVLGRTGSIITQTSTSSIRGPHSRRSSIVGQPPSVVPGTPQLSSDRIISWRQGIEGNGNSTSVSRPTSMTMTPPTRSERSVSPAKARTPATNLASEARRQPYVNSSPMLGPVSPTSSITKDSIYITPVKQVTKGRPPKLEKIKDKQDEKEKQDKQQQRPGIPPTPSFSFLGRDDEEKENEEKANLNGDTVSVDPATGGQSSSFWNLSRWKGLGMGKQSDKGHSRANSEAFKLAEADSEKPRRKSEGGHILSATSQQRTDQNVKDSDKTGRPSTPGGRGTGGGDGKYDSGDDNNHVNLDLASPDIIGSSKGHSARGMTTYQSGRRDSIVSRLTSELTSEWCSEGGSEEEMRCTCGSFEFKAKKMMGKQRFMCVRCGRMADA